MKQNIIIQMLKTKNVILSFLLLLLANPSFSQVVVQMQRQQGGTYLIPGKVNGLDLNFIFDTGASNVCISATEAIFMLKNGYLKDTDVKGVSYSQIANGDIVENTEIILREVEVGGITIKNVSAVVAHNLNAPLLFGQSAIQKLGPIQLDGEKLIIKNGRDFKSDEKSFDFYKLAFQANEAENFNEALKLGEKALEMANTSRYKGLAYTQIVRAYGGLNDVNNAIKFSHEGLAVDPMNEEIGYNLGVLYYDSNQKGKAKNIFEHFINDHLHTPTSNPDITKRYLGGAFGYLANIQKEEGLVANAESNYKKSITFLPTHQGSYINLAGLYYEQLKYDSAAEYFEKAISFIPNRPSSISCYHHLGLCYFHLNNIEKAKESFVKCDKVYLKNFDILKKDTTLFNNAFQDKWFVDNCFIPYIEANQWKARLASTPQECIDGYHIVQDYEMQSMLTADDYKHFAKACAATNNSLELFLSLLEGHSMYPEDVDIAYMLSTQMKEGDEKIKILEDILKYENDKSSTLFDYGTIYNNIAFSYCVMHDYRKGLPYSQQAVKLNPEHDYSWETLGEIFYYLGQFEDCINAMTKCIKLNSKHKAAYKFRGDAEIKIGKNRDGEKDLRIAESFGN